MSHTSTSTNPRKHSFLFADLPGVKKEDIRVDVERNHLILQGHLSSERIHSVARYFYHERCTTTEELVPGQGFVGLVKGYFAEVRENIINNLDVFKEGGMPLLRVQKG